jgi:zinc protease
MTELVENLKKQPVTQEEVDRARRAYLAEHERAWAKSTTIAVELSEWIASGDWRLLFLHRDRVMKVTPEDVMRVAEAYLRQTNRTTGMYLPSQEVVRTKIPQAPSVAELVKDYKGGAAVSKGEAFDPTFENIDRRLKRAELPGGVKVALLPKKTRGETVVLDLTLRFGNEKSLTGKTVAVAFVGPLLMTGTKKFTQEQLSDELDRLKATLNTGTDLGELSASIEAKRETLPQVLELLREVLRAPTFPKDRFDILRGAYKQSLEKSLSEPGSLADNALGRKLNPYPRGDVRYRPTIQETIAQVERVTLDEVVQLYREQMGATVGEVVIVGDFDTDATLKQLGDILGGWRSAVAYERIASAPNLKVPGGRESIVTPDKENAVLVAAHQFKLRDTDPDYLPLRLGNYLFGGSTDSRLFARLRVKDGLSYGASSSLSISSYPTGRSSFRIEATCPPADIDRAEKAVLEELQRLLKDGVTQAEVDAAIKGYLAEIQVARADDANVAGLLAGALHLGRQLSHYADQERRLAEVTAAQVNAAVRAHLDPRRLVIVRAGDFKKQ